MRRLPIRGVMVGALAALMLVSVACRSSDDASPGAETPTGTTGTATPVLATPDAVQVLRVNLPGEPQTLDPQRATDSVSNTILQNIYSGLLRISPDLTVEADLATEVPTVENGGISGDGLTYTFHLRDGLKWSDGSPLVAEAFVDAARRLFEPGAASYYADFYRVLAAPGPDGDANLGVRVARREGVTGEDLLAREALVGPALRVEAPDARTVVFHLNTRTPVFLQLVSLWPMYPVRQDVIDANGALWTEAGTHISNGPFRLQTWDHGQRVEIVRNEHWHGAPPTLTSVQFSMIGDAAVTFLAYRNGELDITTLGAAELVQVRDDIPLREEFIAYAQLSTVGIYFNLADPMLEDVRVRQALAGGFDRQEYAEIVREGAVLPAYGWVPPGMPGHDPEVGARYRDAVEASRKLLEDAGFPGGAGLTVTILSVDTTTSNVSTQWLQQQWERNLGITVNVANRDTATYVAERAAGKYSVVLGGWGADYPDPQNWLHLFQAGGAFNSGAYRSDAFDRLVDAAALELDNDRRIQLYMEAQRVLIDDAPFTPLYYGRRNALVKSWVKGLVPSSMEGEIPGDLYFDRVVISGRP
ncbi:MAG: peptide ABC transporter substrate-binding protein [Dehalococcoidia bacterium]|nr:peptide ABC transporter substrate-binding protein [Dehalococcoidia bacterium]